MPVAYREACGNVNFELSYFIAGGLGQREI